MKKYLMFLLIASLIVTALCGVSAAADDQQECGSSIGAVAYDANTDYMLLMIRYAAAGDIEAMENALISRNAKIADMGLDYPMLFPESFLDNFEIHAGFNPDTDYMSIMMNCCVRGDVDGGIQAAEKRNKKIDMLDLDVAKIEFMDLYLVSKIITAEAGSSWLSMDWKMMVGEVLLNRVASTEFPNTIPDVIHAPGQYYSKSNRFFANLKPYESCVQAAVRLLNGQRILNDPSVVYQANFRQGSGVHTQLYDKWLGYTYLCHSTHMELYENIGGAE